MPVSIAKTAWGGWANCYRITNGEVELIVTADVGPRIMRYAFAGQPNMFLEIPSQLGTSGESVFTPRGGHRIWTAPEHAMRTYAADNFPVEVSIQGSSLTVTALPEKESGIRKSILVRLASTGSAVSVIHTLENTLPWAVEVAPWALTMMAPGGVGIAGFPPRGTHPEDLPPTNPLVMWAFTDLSDPRWSFTQRHLILRQDASRPQPTKLGLFNPSTWGAYFLRDTVFLKRYSADLAKTYPDFGASYETFANGETLELETLGPLTRLAPGQTMDHTERWTLHAGVGLERFEDDVIERVIKPLL
jgi:hypothetical protein